MKNFSEWSLIAELISSKLFSKMCKWTVLFLFAVTYHTIWRVNVEGSSDNVLRSMKLSLSNKKNQTGHWITSLSIDKAPLKQTNAWNVDLEHTITENNGLQYIHLKGLVTAYPEVPTDYELFHGIGYYKFHDAANGFEEASTSCSKEGGHLVIVNSEAESNVLQTIFKRQTGNKANWAFIGMHDRYKEGDFVTIFNQPVNTTGFNRWYSASQPNGGNRANCGTMHRNGGLNDELCHITLPFLCEFDLSWSDH